MSDPRIQSADLIQALERNLDPRLWRLIRLSGELATAQGASLYLVGGRARDLLLGTEGGDMDLMVEGDAPALARALAASEGGEVLTHSRFGTAKYRKDDLTIDLATARTEVYSRPGALPAVRPGPIEEDLKRRDFTINAMAIRLSPPRLGELLDPFDGRGDLEKGIIRILHPRSFIDDATRILRAIRYEQRLGFRLEEETESLLRRDLSNLETVGFDRLRHELELLLQEERPEQALGRAEELGVLKQIHPSLRGNGWLREAFQRAQAQRLAPSPDLYLALLLYRLDPSDARGFVSRYRFTREQERSIHDLMGLKAQVETLEASGLRPSQVYALLQGVSEDALKAFLIACGAPQAQKRVRLYLEELKELRPCLDGHALKALGVPSGPEMGQMMRSLLEARLDGEVRSKEEEIAFVKRALGTGR